MRLDNRLRYGIVNYGRQLSFIIFLPFILMIFMISKYFYFIKLAFQKYRNLLLSFLSFIFTFLFFYYYLNPHMLYKFMENYRIDLFFTCFLMASLHPIIGAVRWHSLCIIFNHRVTFNNSVKTNIIGSFVQNFMPGGLGSDITKLFLDEIIPSKRLLLIIFLDRLFLALSTFLLFMLSFFNNAYFIFFCIIILFNLIIFIITYFLLIFFKLKINKNSFIFFFIKYIVFYIFLILTIMNFICIFYLILTNNNAQLHFIEFFKFPISVLLSSLPISIGGFGIREWMNSILFSDLLGVTQDDVLNTSIFFGIFFLVSSTSNLLFYLLYWVSKRYFILNRVTRGSE